MNKTTTILLSAGFTLCILQVWWPDYYITGDGPCHLYNAQVLHDLWAGRNIAFYTRFFKINPYPDPNWLTTIILALLLFIVKGVIAEKIYLTLYIILYLAGFQRLLRQINNGTSAWPVAIFIFIFTTTLAKGFYNYSFGVAFFFWVVWGWLRFLEKPVISRAGLFFLFALLLFFTHFLPFIFAAITCAALVASYALTGAGGEKKATRYYLEYSGYLGLLLLPYMALMVLFLRHEGGRQLSLHHHFYRLIELVQFKYIINETHREGLFTAIGSITLLLLFGLSFILNRERFKVHKYDGILASLLIALFVYLFFPDDVPGFLEMPMRVQLLVFILVACCIAYRLPGPKIKNVGALVMIVCFIGLSIVRVSTRAVASQAVAAYCAAAQFIRPGAVVLPLDFAPGGEDEKGNTISDRNWLFTHMAGYLGTEKPMVILDNYEANTGYFPLTWEEKTNPYLHLSRDEGIEGCPPYASIRDYKQASGVMIDYILLWCYHASYLQYPHFCMLYNEIISGYHPVYTSTSARVILFEKN